MEASAKEEKINADAIQTTNYNTKNQGSAAGGGLQVSTVLLYGVPIVSLVIESQERLCLAQISNTLLKEFSYNEIHNRRVALGITCVQCTPVQLEILRRAGAMPVSSRRCGMITRREAERLCKSFLGDNAPPRLPEDFAFAVHHECAWGCRGAFLPARYNSSRAKCIKCSLCGLFFSPNKFIFHSHRTGPTAKYVQPDAANFNSWRRHMKLSGQPPDEVVHAWEDVKAMFNGGTRKRLLASNNSHSIGSNSSSSSSSGKPSPAKQSKTEESNHSAPGTVTLSLGANNGSATAAAVAAAAAAAASVPTPRIPPFPELPLPAISRSLVMDYVYGAAIKHHHHHPPPPPPPPPPPAQLAAAFPAAYAGLPWFKPTSLADAKLYQSAFRPVLPHHHPRSSASPPPAPLPPPPPPPPPTEISAQDSEEETVDIETTEEGPSTPGTWTKDDDEKPSDETTNSNDEQSLNEGESASAGAPPGMVKPDPDATRGERLWAVARLSLERHDPARVLYRHEMARLHLIRELAAPSANDPVAGYMTLPEHVTAIADRRANRYRDSNHVLHNLAAKVPLDCSTCQLYNHSPK